MLTLELNPYYPPALIWTSPISIEQLRTEVYSDIPTLIPRTKLNSVQTLTCHTHFEKLVLFATRFLRKKYYDQPIQYSIQI